MTTNNTQQYPLKKIATLILFMKNTIEMLSVATTINLKMKVDELYYLA